MFGKEVLHFFPEKKNYEYHQFNKDYIQTRETSLIKRGDSSSNSIIIQ